MSDDVRTLGRLEKATETLEQLVEKLESRLNAQDQRISNLEHGRSWLFGAAAAISFAISIITAAFQYGDKA